MLLRVALGIVVVLAGCTAIRPLDAADGGPAVDATSSGDAAGRDAASADDTGLDAFIVDSGLDAAAAPDAEAPDAGVDAAMLPLDTGCGAEVCGGGDEDCDGMVDEAGAVGSMPYYPDTDSDNYGDDSMVMMLCRSPAGTRYVMRGGDCDDTNRQVNPGRAELCNGRDDDCDGTIDDGLTGCVTSCTMGSYGGHTYQFCPTPRTEPEAAAACGATSHLVNIGDGGENDFVRTQASALGLGTGGLAQGIWIGLGQDTAIPPVWRWTDGSAASYLAWDPATAEPNGTGPFARMRTTSGLWAEALATSMFPYVCETP
jgi:hypothetical protein